MTPSNGNIFRVTGPLWGESTVTGGFLLQGPVVQSFVVFFDLRLNKGLAKIETPVIWNTIALIMTSC